MMKKKKRILDIVSLILFIVFYVLANILNAYFGNAPFTQILSKICFILSGAAAMIWICGSDFIYDKTRKDIDKNDAAKYVR